MSLETSAEFDIDLHVISDDGRHVGMNYSTGVYENEIEGATSSGDIPGGGPEWIELPSDVLFRAYLDASPALEWASELGLLAEDWEIRGEIRFIHFDGVGERTQTDPMELDAVKLETASPPVTALSVINLITHGPNPVPSEGCVFWLDLPDDGVSATLKIFDVDGALLVSISLDPLADRYPAAGRWIPENDQGRLLGTGLYIYLVEVEHADGTTTYSPARKMVIQR